MLVSYRFSPSEHCFVAGVELPKEPQRRYRCTAAFIVGSDPNYILNRTFLHLSCNPMRSDRCHEFFLTSDGIYELTVKEYETEVGACIHAERMWLVVLDGILYPYADDEMNYQDVLHAAFNLNLQRRSTP